MGTNRTRKPRRAEPIVPDYKIEFFKNGENEKCWDDMEFFFWIDTEQERDWKRNREKVLSDWINERPGSRPHGFWAFDAPEPRLQVGGDGKLCQGTLFYDFGLPNFCHWIKVNENDPPLFESQAAYLLRLNLLTKSEENWLKMHQNALKPVRFDEHFEKNEITACTGAPMENRVG